MQFLLYTIYLVHVLVSLFLILVVLLQQGQGADLAVFGGGSTQAAFGARSATTLLHKLTVAGFVVFILTTLSVAILRNRGTADTSVVPASAAAVEQTTEGVADTPPSQDGDAPAAAATDDGTMDGDTDVENIGDGDAMTPATEPADDGGTAEAPAGSDGG